MTRIDNDRLHSYLWNHHTDSRGKLTIAQIDLADELGVHQPNLSVRIKKMVQSGRMKKVGSSFYVVDPVVWGFTNKMERTWI